MRISVNLASRPFVELRPFFARLRIFMAALAVLAIALGIGLHFEHKKLVVAQQQMDEVRDRTIAAQKEKLRNEARMRQPANAAVLDRAHFLNALFLRKSFSWTAVMMDLENVLPTGVQVTAIEPQITADGDVIIRLRVSGDRDRAVQLVRNLERSSRFLAPRLASETAHKTETGSNAAANAAAPGAVEFDILADYNPLPAGANVVPVSSKTPAAAATTPRVKRAPKAGTNDGVVLKPFANTGGPR
ncbi:MAG: PilN domain-containing protein [Acidobacteriaceae bacterium]